MIYRVDYDSDKYKALYIPALQLIKIMKGKMGAGSGGPLVDNWQNVTGTLEQKKEGAVSDDVADISFWHHSPVFSEKAYAQLVGALSCHGEFLPVDVAGTLFYVFNILERCDKLVDLDNSEKNIVDGVQAGINTVVFQAGDFPAIFKTDFDNAVRVFCTNEFKVQVEATGLTGLTFSEDLQ